jgi:triphosphoribosyl-dephospho-CoA synthase
MTSVADTAVLARHGPAGLERVRAEAREAVLLGGIGTREGREKILAMEKVFAEEGLNPGGSADMLALTVFFYLLEEQIPAEQLLFPSVFSF